MDLSKIFLKDACPTSIGGQAIMEGVMMRGTDRLAIACRVPDGRIHIKTQALPPPKPMMATATAKARKPILQSGKFKIVRKTSKMVFLGRSGTCICSGGDFFSSS